MQLMSTRVTPNIVRTEYCTNGGMRESRAGDGVRVTEITCTDGVNQDPGALGAVHTHHRWCLLRHASREMLLPQRVLLCLVGWYA
jgi:hypothetical protein